MAFKIDAGGITRLGEQIATFAERLEDEAFIGLSELAEATAARARANAEAARPERLTRQRADRSYHWRDLVNSIEADASGRVPYVAYGNDRVPGWSSWDKGSATRPQFGPRRTGGKFFGPALDDARALLDDVAGDIVKRASRDLEG